jgi:RNA polymerase sigma-70 factor (ECF subfamily)
MSLSPALADEPVEPGFPTTADEVVARYWAQAFRFAAMVAPTNQESQDIAQEALLTVIRKLDRFDPTRGDFDAWLWRVVLNVAKDAGRASLRRASLFDRVLRDHSTVAAPDIENIAVQRIDDADLLSAVRALKPRPRTLIAMRFGAQLTYPEIAGHLGISEAAALMATRRALATLRKNMKEAR